MVIVSAVAFGVGALCLYYGARDLRTRRAIRHLKGRRDAHSERTDAQPDRTGGKPEWTDTEPGLIDAHPERSNAQPERTGTSVDRPGSLGTAAPVDDPPEDPGEDVAIERGFVLLALGGLCLLFGILAF